MVSHVHGMDGVGVRFPVGPPGSVPERLNGPHSKCGMPEMASEVRILPLPPVRKLQVRVARLVALGG